MKKILIVFLLLIGQLSYAQIGYFSYGNKKATTGAEPTREYATWNPSDKSANVTLSNGDLTAARNGGSGVVRATMGKASGKWYWEITLTSTGGTWDCFTGMANNSAVLTGNLGANINGWSVVMDDGGYYNNGAIGLSGAGTFPATTGDVFGFELNLTDGTLKIYQNDVALTPNPLFTGLLGQTYYPAISVQAQNNTLTANFGASAFTYTGHTGFNQGIYN